MQSPNPTSTAYPANEGQIQLDVFARSNNGYHWAAETDVFEAIAAGDTKSTPNVFCCADFRSAEQAAGSSRCIIRIAGPPPKSARGPGRVAILTMDTFPEYQRPTLRIDENMTEWALDAEYTLRTLIAVDPQPEEVALPKPDELRVTLKAGMHTIGVDFPRDSSKPEVAPLMDRRVSGGGSQSIPMEIRLDGQRVKALQVKRGAVSTQLNSLTIGGPYNPTGKGDTPSRARIFTCRPVERSDEEKCARMILTQLARRAFRQSTDGCGFAAPAWLLSDRPCEWRFR